MPTLKVLKFKKHFSKNPHRPVLDNFLNFPQLRLYISSLGEKQGDVFWQGPKITTKGRGS